MKKRIIHVYLRPEDHSQLAMLAISINYGLSLMDTGHGLDRISVQHFKAGQNITHYRTVSYAHMEEMTLVFYKCDMSLVPNSLTNQEAVAFSTQYAQAMREKGYETTLYKGIVFDPNYE